MIHLINPHFSGIRLQHIAQRQWELRFCKDLYNRIRGTAQRKWIL